MLIDINYVVWAMKMKFILRNLRVWKAIEGDGEVDDEVDEGAMAAPWLLSRSPYQTPW